MKKEFHSSLHGLPISHQHSRVRSNTETAEWLNSLSTDIYLIFILQHVTHISLASQPDYVSLGDL